MAQKSKPRTTEMPFRGELGPRVGSGQDNAVYQLLGRHEKPHLRPPLGVVLKINHKTAAEHRVRFADDRKAAWSGVLYKKNKYDILKRFLGDYIPNSLFVLGVVNEGRNRRYAEYTLQEEVPRLSLNDLTTDQKQDPRLKSNVVDLMNRLKTMYSVLGEANARTADGISLDGKLDLGGVSDYVLAEAIDHKYDEADAQAIIDSNSSANLLVDPDTMALYCVDFDQGQWRSGMDEAKAMVFEIADRRDNEKVVKQMGQVAVGIAQGTLPFYPIE